MPATAGAMSASTDPGQLLGLFERVHAGDEAAQKQLLAHARGLGNLNDPAVRQKLVAELQIFPTSE